MPRTLPSGPNIARQRRSVSVVPLVEFSLYRDRFAAAAPEPTLLHLSDAHRIGAQAELGLDWFGLVKKIGPIRQVARTETEVVGGTEPMTLDIDNTKAIAGRAKFSDLFRQWQDDDAAAFDVSGSEVTVLWVLKGAGSGGAVFQEDAFQQDFVGLEGVWTAGHEVVVGRLIIDSAQLIEPETVRLQCVGLARYFDLLAPALIGDVAAFPKIKEASRGQKVPYRFAQSAPLGATLRSRGIPVVWGAKVALDGAITATNPANSGDLIVRYEPDFDRFLAADDLIVDNEVIGYTDRLVDTNGYTARFKNITRAKCTTAAASHSAGATVQQRVTDVLTCTGSTGHVWVFGENPPGLKEKAAVSAYTVWLKRSDGTFRQTLGDASLNLDNTALVPGRSLVTKTSAFGGVEDPPTSAPIPASASPPFTGGLSAGTYQWLTTFVTALGETSAGTASTPFTASVGHRVNLTGIPTGGSAVTARKLYRTVANGGVYKLLTTINDNTTTTFLDTVADAALGADAPTVNTTAGPDYEYWLEGPGLADDTGLVTGFVNTFFASPPWVIAAVLHAAYGQGRRPTAAKQPTLRADDASIGTVAWTIGTNATVDLTTGQVSHYFKQTGFGFTIPLGARIAGIKVGVTLHSTGGVVFDESVRLTVNGVAVGENKARPTTAWPAFSGLFEFGGLNDTWGLDWTPSQVNLADFGILIAAKLPTAASSTASIFITTNPTTITVWYTYLGKSFAVLANRFDDGLASQWALAYRHPTFSDFQRWAARQSGLIVHMAGGLWEIALTEPRDGAGRMLEVQDRGVGIPSVERQSAFPVAASVAVNHGYNDATDRYYARTIYTAPPEVLDRFGARTVRIPQALEVQPVGGVGGTPAVARAPGFVSLAAPRDWDFPWLSMTSQIPRGTDVAAGRLMDTWLRELTEPHWAVRARQPLEALDLAALDGISLDVAPLKASDPDGLRTFEVQTLSYDLEGTGVPVIEVEGVEEMAIQPPMGQWRLNLISSALIRLDRRRGRYGPVKDAGGWKLRALPAAGVSIANTGLAADTTYNVYLYDNLGTLTLELNTLAHSADTETGTEVKSTDTTRTFLGSVRTDGGALFNTVRSWYHRQAIVYSGGFTANRTTASTSFTEVNTEIRLPILCLGDEVVEMEITGGSANDIVGHATHTSIGIDSTSVAEDVQSKGTSAIASALVPIGITFSKVLAEGFHFITLLGKVSTAGTGTWLGAAAGAGAERCTLRAALAGTP